MLLNFHKAAQVSGKRRLQWRSETKVSKTQDLRGRDAQYYWFDISICR